MFEFITKFFRKKAPTTLIVKMDSSPPSVDPSKDKVVKDVGDMPDTVRESGIERSEGHINFNNMKPITRKLKRGNLRKSFEERQTSYYDNGGELYGD